MPLHSIPASVSSLALQDAFREQAKASTPIARNLEGVSNMGEQTASPRKGIAESDHVRQDLMKAELGALLAEHGMIGAVDEFIVPDGRLFNRLGPAAVIQRAMKAMPGASSDTSVQASQEKLARAIDKVLKHTTRNSDGVYSTESRNKPKLDGALSELDATMNKVLAKHKAPLLENVFKTTVFPAVLARIQAQYPVLFDAAGAWRGVEDFNVEDFLHTQYYAWILKVVENHCKNKDPSAAADAINELLKLPAIVKSSKAPSNESPADAKPPAAPADAPSPAHGNGANTNTNTNNAYAAPVNVTVSPMWSTEGANTGGSGNGDTISRLTARDEALTNHLMRMNEKLINLLSRVLNVNESLVSVHNVRPRNAAPSNHAYAMATSAYASASEEDTQSWGVNDGSFILRATDVLSNFNRVLDSHLADEESMHADNGMRTYPTAITRVPYDTIESGFFDESLPNSPIIDVPTLFLGDREVETLSIPPSIHMDDDTDTSSYTVSDDDAEFDLNDYGMGEAKSTELVPPGRVSSLRGLFEQRITNEENGAFAASAVSRFFSPRHELGGAMTPHMEDHRTSQQAPSAGGARGDDNRAGASPAVVTQSSVTALRESLADRINASRGLSVNHLRPGASAAPRLAPWAGYGSSTSSGALGEQTRPSGSPPPSPSSTWTPDDGDLIPTRGPSGTTATLWRAEPFQNRSLDQGHANDEVDSPGPMSPDSLLDSLGGLADDDSEFEGRTAFPYTPFAAEPHDSDSASIYSSDSDPDRFRASVLEWSRQSFGRSDSSYENARRLYRSHLDVDDGLSAIEDGDEGREEDFLEPVATSHRAPLANALNGAPPAPELETDRRGRNSHGQGRDTRRPMPESKARAVSPASHNRL
jgi:hypothetical protein